MDGWTEMALRGCVDRVRWMDGHTHAGLSPFVQKDGRTDGWMIHTSVYS